MPWLSPVKTAPGWGFALVAALAAVALEALSWPLYPLRSWMVAHHEFFHALGAWATLGEVVSISTYADHGATMSRGGFYPVVSMAGYLGCALYGAACLRWCARGTMRGAYLGLGGALCLALLWKGRFLDGGWLGAGVAVAIEALALLWVRSKWAPYCLALSGCLFLGMGLDDLRALLVEATSRTDAGLLARHLGMPFLAWPIALAYAGGMCSAWAWAARGLWRDARAG